MAELKRTIASLSKAKGSSDDGNESDTPDNAGDPFWRSSKQETKEGTTLPPIRVIVVVGFWCHLSPSWILMVAHDMHASNTTARCCLHS